MSHFALETTRYDSADYLDSEVAIIAYLKLVLEEGDAADVRAAMNAVSRASGTINVA